jgi:uncharacterized protein (DUF2141 family)
MNRNRIIRRVFFVKNVCISLLLLIMGCANSLPPPGGPEDKTPPVIRHYEPVNGTSNYHKKYVTFEFNKYMDKNKVNENVFVSPTVPIEYDWSGKELEVDFTKPLDSNTTYAVTLGTEYTDLKGNKPAEAFTLIFSTGNNIDSGMIKGTLYDKDPSGAYIFCYGLERINPDTLNFKHTKPLSVIQTGTNGKFEFKALKNGKYRLIAVRDKFKNGIYDEGVDDFGAAANDIFVKQDSAPLLNLKIGPPIDKIGPMLFRVGAVNSRRFIVDFSEDIDTSSVNKTYFSLKDSATQKPIGIVSANILPGEGSSRLDILAASALDTNIKWQFKVIHSDSATIRDTVGNPIVDSLSSVYFYSIAGADTIYPKIIKMPFKDSTQGVNPDENFDFIFNTSIEHDSIERKIKLTGLDTEQVLSYKIFWKDGNHFSVKPEKELLSDTWYILSFKTDSIFGTNGIAMKDTLISLHFKTKDIRSYGGISGTFTGNFTKQFNYYITLVSKDKSYRQTVRADSSGKWDFQKAPAGFYTLEIFQDKDGNGKYSFGDAYPFKFGEPFLVIAQEFEIKPRWKVEGMTIDLQ